jgi:hypothetical protein
MSPHGGKPRWGALADQAVPQRMARLAAPPARARRLVDRNIPASAVRKFGRPQGLDIGLQPCLVTADELGSCPCGDREIPPGRQETPGDLLRLVWPAVLLIDDDEIDKPESGASRVVGLERGDRFLDPP